MLPERWTELMYNGDLRLTEKEIAEGWHFCPDWDSLLIGPGMIEMDYCSCREKDYESNETNLDLQMVMVNICILGMFSIVPK